MEYNLKLLEEFNNVSERKKVVSKELKTIKEQENQLIDRIGEESSFNEMILLAISKLVTYKEGRSFIPFLYKRFNLVNPYPPTYYETIYVGMAFEDDINDFLDSKSENIEKFLGLKQGYEIYQRTYSEIKSYEKDGIDWIIKPYDLTSVNELKRVSFNFIPKHFNLLLRSGVTYSHYNFDDFDYVQDFIVYVFNKQFDDDHHFKTVEEFDQLLNEFMNLDNTKAKTK